MEGVSADLSALFVPKAVVPDVLNAVSTTAHLVSACTACVDVCQHLVGVYLRNFLHFSALGAITLSLLRPQL